MTDRNLTAEHYPGRGLIGEAFAFNRWMISVAIPTGVCRPPAAGWNCAYCQRDWHKLQGWVYGA